MKPSKKSQYLNEYKLGESGKYEYTGGYYVFGGSETQRKKAYALLYSAIAVITALVIISGCLDSAGANNSFYVILPFLGEASGLFALLWSSLTLLTKGERIKSYVFKRSHPKIPTESVILAFFSIAGLICSVLYLISNGVGASLVKSIAYPLLKCITVVLTVLFRNFFIKLNWIEL